MDQRTGDKGYGQTDVTSNELGFELVPIQPLITVDIKNFTIYIKPTVSKLIGVNVTLKALFISEAYVSPHTMSTKIGEVLEIPIERKTHRKGSSIICSIRVYRIDETGTELTSPHLFIPLISSSFAGVHFGSIKYNGSFPFVFHTHQQLQFTINPGNVDARKFYYMIVCDDSDIVESGVVAESGVLKFSITEMLKSSSVNRSSFIRNELLINYYLESACERAGCNYLSFFSEPPPYLSTTSTYSDYCTQHLVLAYNEICKHIQLGMVMDLSTKTRVSSTTYGLADFKSTKPPQSTNINRYPAGVIRPTTEEEIRDFFPELFLFDDYKLNEVGDSMEISLPHSGDWIISSVFWKSGEDVCAADDVTFTVKKDLTLFVNLPTYVYVNETVKVVAEIFDNNPDPEQNLYRIAVRDLQRDVCTDLSDFFYTFNDDRSGYVASYGEKIIKKTFTLRFLKETDNIRIEFILLKFKFKGSLKKEFVGDIVRHNITVRQSAEAEQYLKRLIINKNFQLPFSEKLQCENCADNFIEIKTQAATGKESKLKLDVQLNSDDDIYSLEIEVSRFLKPSTQFAKTSMADVIPESSSNELNNVVFASDAIKKFATLLYEYKALKYDQNLNQQQQLEQAEELAKQLQYAFLQLLSFSNCPKQHKCGFGEYGNPDLTDNYSPILTGISTLLLCQSEAPSDIICPLLQYLMTLIDEKKQLLNDPILHILEFKSIDQNYFIEAVINQVTKDCYPYVCKCGIKGIKSMLDKLQTDLFEAPKKQLGSETIAALAYMGSATMKVVLHSKLYMEEQGYHNSYWVSSRRNATRNVVNQSNAIDSNDQKPEFDIQTDDLLLNTLALLGIDPIERFDSLVDWIQEQLDHTYQPLSALDVYFAKKLLYDYKVKNNEQLNNTDDVEESNAETILINCDGCATIEHRIESPHTVYPLPNVPRKFTITTSSLKKVRIGIKLTSTTRYRQRRSTIANGFLKLTSESVIDDANNPHTKICIQFSTFQGFAIQYVYSDLVNTSKFETYQKQLLLVDILNTVFILVQLIKLGKQAIFMAFKTKLEAEPSILDEIFINPPKYDSKLSNGVDELDLLCWNNQCSCAMATEYVQCTQCSMLTATVLNRELCLPRRFGSF
uniref:A2M domain-containing protein n=1 Tax=Syphacia muris TaxID=451379 RepID=A0A0N5AEY1_9BILA